MPGRVSLTIPLSDLAATEAFAGRLAARLAPGMAVLLTGQLGAGKTALVRAALRALTGDPALEVPSPSFTLVQSYDTPKGPAHHYDLWRIEETADLMELGLDEALREIAFVEWPDRLGDQAPEGAVRVELVIGEDEARVAWVEGPEEVVAALAAD